MRYSPMLSLMGGLQGPEFLFILAILLGGFLIVVATFFFVIRAAMKSAMKSNQAESQSCAHKRQK